MSEPVSTLLCMLLDRSGSMQAIKSDVDGGFDAFVARHRAVGGECHVTLNQFDTEYERRLTHVDVRTVPPLDLQPRGGTALLDAIGRTVTDLQSDLDALPPAARPQKVIVVILTDGLENASVEWTYPAVRQLVASKQPAWDFAFIGADQDAVTEGARLGVQADAAVSTRATGASAAASFAVLGDVTTRARWTGEQVAYSPEERERSLGDDET